MIVDDELDICNYLMAVLEDNGYDTCFLEEGQPISEAVRSCGPDLILLDIMMPMRSGVSLYKELQSTGEFENIPIAIISGMMPEEDFKMGFNKLVNDSTIPYPDGFIEKPVKLNEMLTVVRNILNT